jgi:hypothetical protein
VDLSDFLPWKKSDERNKDVDALNNWLTAAVELARGEYQDAAPAALLTEQFAAMPAAEIRRLTAAAGASLGDAAATLESVRHAHDQPVHDAADVYRRLSLVSRQVGREAGRLRRRDWLIGAARLAIYAAPVVFGYFVATYFRLHNNVYAESTTVLSPSAIYEQAGASYRIRPARLDVFFREFGKAYFGKPNSFAEEFAAVQSRSPVKMRFVFRNPRNAEPLLVSSVQPLLTFHEVPFDWSKIDVAADLKITASASGFEIKDDGAGPAVAVKYRVATGALDLIRGEYPYLLNQTATLSFSRPTLPVRALELDHETPPGLVDRAYRPIEEVPIGAPTRTETDPSILRCGGSRFEIITTLARLSELAPVVRGGTATLEISFETLRGKGESRSASAKLPEDLVFVKETPELLLRNPCPNRATAAPGPPPAPPPPPSRLADVLSGTPANLKGVDLIKTTATLDLSNVPDGGVVAAVLTPDEILNAGGFLILDLAIGQPRNGAVDVEVSINGAPLQLVTCQLLAPDRFRFSGEIEQEKKRFAIKR